jgi:hypothetical protein
MKSRFGPGRRQGSQSGTAFGCVFGSQALVMSAQEPVPKEVGTRLAVTTAQSGVAVNSQGTD